MAWILVCSKCDRERLRQHDPKEVSGCCGAPLVIADRNDRAGLRRCWHPDPDDDEPSLPAGFSPATDPAEPASLHAGAEDDASAPVPPEVRR